MPYPRAKGPLEGDGKPSPYSEVIEGLGCDVLGSFHGPLAPPKRMKIAHKVTPAKAGVQFAWMDSRLRGNDVFEADFQERE